jgi:hypothetical protein
MILLRKKPNGMSAFVMFIVLAGALLAVIAQGQQVDGPVSSGTTVCTVREINGEAGSSPSPNSGLRDWRGKREETEAIVSWKLFSSPRSSRRE